MTALPEGERLQKVLARVGLASRRASEELIVKGRVTVNGEIAGLGRRVDTRVDRVEVEGTPIPIAPGLVHLLLNKPRGVVSTVDDPQGRPTVVELVPAEPRLFPVGRLDQDTEGLLILTNDGGLTHRLTHPRYGVDKEYLVHVRGRPTRGELRRLREGVELADGVTAPAEASLVAPELLRLVIHEGRNRQVRRMCEAVGHPVERLVRIRIGPVTDRRLKPGTWRELTVDEVLDLERAAQDRGSGVPGRPG
jgi:23S rRNA pseudouridine2605 synthase